MVSLLFVTIPCNSFKAHKESKADSGRETRRSASWRGFLERIYLKKSKFFNHFSSYEYRWYSYSPNTLLSTKVDL
jgi:hypothetical protein